MNPSTSNRGTMLLHLAVASLLALNVVVIFAWPFARGTSLRHTLAPMYAALCHQIPSRTLHLAGEPMPVCARCLGFWLGLALAAWAATWGAHRLGLWRTSTACCLMGLMLVDWGLGRAGLPAEWHPERTIVGALGGIGVYMLATQIATWALPRLDQPHRRAERVFHAVTRALRANDE